MMWKLTKIRIDAPFHDIDHQLRRIEVTNRCVQAESLVDCGKIMISLPALDLGKYLLTLLMFSKKLKSRVSARFKSRRYLVGRST